MSETKKRKGRNPAIACCNMTAGKEIVVNQGKFGPSQNDINSLAGMEIKVEGYEIVYDKQSGKVLRVKDTRTIGEVIDDRRIIKIKDAMKAKEGIEH